MSKLTTLHHQIAMLFSEKMNLDIPSVDADLFETGVIDSLAFVELLLHLEQGFGIKASLDDIEIDNFKSIERIAEFVANHNGLKGTPQSWYRKPDGGFHKFL